MMPPSSSTPAQPTPGLRFELSGITKHYPGVVANDQVSLAVQPGQIHAVLGENGAGKSTLMKIIYGVVQPDAGQLWFNGQAVRIRSPHAARDLGISMVFQHFSLFESLSVADNVWLGLARTITHAQVVQHITSKANAYGLDIDPHRPVHSLPVGQMQRVEIIRALLTHPQLLILDEPTSVLTPQATEKLFTVLRQLAGEGCSIVYISHKLHEIRALCNACTVLRNGKVAGRCDPSQESIASLSRMMIGAAPPPIKHQQAHTGATLLAVQDLTLPRETPFGVDLHGIHLQVQAGEVVGIAGVSGNGQREFLHALTGEDTRAPVHSIHIADTAVGNWPPQARRALGLQSVPEERLGRGAIASMSLAHNLLLARDEALRRLGWIDMHALRAQAAGIIARFNVKAGGPGAPAKSLSGGNLQKFLVGRAVDAAPKVLVVAQPTWGVDVGAAAQIRQALLALRDTGCAVLVVSEELEELLEISDRLHVMAQGRLSPSIPIQEADAQRIGQWMSGLWEAPPGAAQERFHA
jgi:general nucleoside transport system ATP-binding protein